MKGKSGWGNGNSGKDLESWFRKKSQQRMNETTIDSKGPSEIGSLNISSLDRPISWSLNID